MKCPKCRTDNPTDSRYCRGCAAPLPEARGHVPDSPKVAAFPQETETIQTAVKELATGSTFAGRYQIIEELGKGGMGRVYKVFDTEINEKIALKLVKPEVAEDRETIERFRNELKLARQISHKNVCRMFDLGRSEETRYITMEYISGEDLKSFIKRVGQLPASKAILIAKQVCEGLAEAHRLGVVHRDLKPQNIMVDREGNARIMDFGIARSIQARGITGAGMMIGTPEYMSPEQVEGKEADHRSDIYALGVILFEALTGRVPFEGDTPLSIAFKHKTQMPPNPKEFNPQISDNIVGVVAKCLEKEKEKRYQSAGELISDLEKLEKGVPTTERALPLVITATEKHKRINWKKFVLYGGSSLLLILIIIAAFSLFTGRKEPVHSIAVLPFENTSANPEMEYISDGMAESLINKLAQFPGLKVISRFSAFQYKGKKVGLEKIGSELNIGAVLTGRINQRGDNLSIAAELINVKDNTLIWGEQYNRKTGDIFSVQEEISREISRKLGLRLTGEEKRLLATRYTENAEAYSLYLQGRFYWNRRTLADLKKAIAYFEQAVALDPQFALGYSSLAETYVVLGSLAIGQPKVVYPKAEEYGLKALAINDELAEAHAAMGQLKQFWTWDFRGAENEYLRAIKLNPNYATAHQWLAEVYMITSKYPTAHEEIRKAIDLDPHAIIMRHVQAGIYMGEGKYDEAVQIESRLVNENPDFDAGRSALIFAYVAKKNYEEALNVAEGLRQLGWKELLKGAVYALRGDQSSARTALKKYQAISQETYIDPAIVAYFYGNLGELDKTFALYEQALEERSPLLLLFDMMSPSDRVKQDPRFKGLLKKIGLEK